MFKQFDDFACYVHRVTVLQMDVTIKKQVDEAFEYVSHDVGEHGKYDANGFLIYMYIHVYTLSLKESS